MQDGSWLYLGSIVVGLFFGFLILLAADSEEKKKAVYKRLETVAIKVLLPVHIFLTVIRSKGLFNLEDFFLLIFFGIFYSCLAIILAYFITQLAFLKNTCHPHLKYATGTFGGGGRAIVLIAALQPFLSNNSRFSTTDFQGASFDALAIFDLGYWVFFCAIIYGYIMPLSFKAIGKTRDKQVKDEEDDGDEEQPLNSGHLAVVLAAVAGTMLVFVGPERVIDAAGGIENVNNLRNLTTAAIVALAAAAFAVRFQAAKFGPSIGFIILIISIRFIAFAGPTYYIANQYEEYFNNFLFIPVFIFLVSPPSSFLQFMLSDVGAKEDVTQQVININASWNILYFGFVVILLITSLVNKFI